MKMKQGPEKYELWWRFPKCWHYFGGFPKLGQNLVLTPSEGGSMPFSTAPSTAHTRPSARKFSSLLTSGMCMPSPAIGSAQCKVAQGRDWGRLDKSKSTNLSTVLGRQGKQDWRRQSVAPRSKVNLQLSVFEFHIPCHQSVAIFLAVNQLLSSAASFQALTWQIL